jgi:hypothetical protein
LPPFKHALAERDGGAQSRGVFVDVKRAVKMRDAQAFQFQFLVDDKLRAEIGIQQFAVFAADGVHRQRFAGFHQRVE